MTGLVLSDCLGAISKLENELDDKQKAVLLKSLSHWLGFYLVKTKRMASFPITLQRQHWALYAGRSFLKMIEPGPS